MIALAILLVIAFGLLVPCRHLAPNRAVAQGNHNPLNRRAAQLPSGYG